MTTPQPPHRFGERFSVLYISQQAASWGMPGGTSFVHYSGRLMVRYGAAVAVPALGVMVLALLNPMVGWGVAPLVVMFGGLAWMVALHLGSNGGQKITNKDLSDLAWSAAKAMGMSTSLEAWRVQGPQAERLGAELRRLSSGLTTLSVPPDVPREQIERDWLAEQVSPEFARYLPNAALTSSGTEPDAVEVDSFTAGEPWPTLENRNRQWPVLGGTDQPGAPE